MKTESLAYLKDRYETLYNDLKVGLLDNTGFGRNYVHDYYVSGYYPPACVMEEVTTSEHNEIIESLQGDSTLYFHYPACTNNCIYCHYYKDSYSKFKTREKEYTSCLLKEMNYILRGKNINIKYMYFGGGTPSLFSNDALEQLESVLHNEYAIPKDIEIRFEVFTQDYSKNDSFEKKLKILKKLGVTTIVLDMQSLDQKILDNIGRANSGYNQLLQLLDVCKQNGFNDFHTSLLIGLPYQTWDIFQDNLQRLVDLNVFNLINIYVIFNKAEDRYHSWRLKQPEIFPTNKEIDMMIMFAREYLQDHGYTEGPLYWFYRRVRKAIYPQSKDIKNHIGFGAAAQSLLSYNNSEYYYFNLPEYNEYIDSFASKPHAVWRANYLNEEYRLVKKFIGTLYNAKRVDITKMQQKFSINILDYYSDSLKLLKYYNLIDYNEHEVKLTELGLLRAERVIYFFANDHVRIENDRCVSEYSFNIKNGKMKESIPVGKFSYFPTLSNEDKRRIVNNKERIGIQGLKSLEYPNV